MTKDSIVNYGLQLRTLKKIEKIYNQHILRIKQAWENTMAPPKKNVDKNVFYEFIDKWNKPAGGFVSPYIAAKIFGVTKAHICKNWQKMNLERIIFDGKPFITFNSIYREFKQRETEEEMASGKRKRKQQEEKKQPQEKKFYTEFELDENTTLTIEKLNPEEVASKIAQRKPNQQQFIILDNKTFQV